MTRYLSAAALSAMLVGISAPALALDPELNMLTGKVYNELAIRDIDTSTIQDLTVGQLAAIKAVLDSDDSEGKKTSRIKAIMANN